MARYIDADKINFRGIEPELNKHHIYMIPLLHAEIVVKTQPTAEVVEVKHGEWKHKRATIDGEHYYCCSECGREVSVNMYDNPSVTKFYPYCHCGAKMDVTDTNVGK